METGTSVYPFCTGMALSCCGPDTQKVVNRRGRRGWGGEEGRRREEREEGKERGGGEGEGRKEEEYPQIPH